MTIAEVATSNSPLQDMFCQLQRQGQTFQEASEAVIRWVADAREAPVFQTGGMNVPLQNLLCKWMLVPDWYSRRQLAECLNHDFFSASDAMQTAADSCIPRPFGKAKSDPSPNRPQPGEGAHPQGKITSSQKQTDRDAIGLCTGHPFGKAKSDPSPNRPQPGEG